MADGDGSPEEMRGGGVRHFCRAVCCSTFAAPLSDPPRLQANGWTALRYPPAPTAKPPVNFGAIDPPIQ
eukprot:8192302-Pyramimonas_sp.AAC.1